MLNQPPIKSLFLITTTLFSLLIACPIVSAQNCAPSPAGLVSWWPGDGNANDIVGLNQGTLRNGATFASGLVGPAFSLDGTDDFVEVPNSPSLMLAGPFTVEFWFKLNTTFDPFTAASPGFISKGFFDSINLANNDGRLEVRGPVPRANSTTNTWLAGVWYHVAVTYDGMEYKIYVNGSQEGGILSSHSILNNADNVAIGSIPAFLPGPVSINGLIDEMTMYNRALTASEVQATFNAGGAGKCKAITVGIDIKTGSFPNSINLGSNGVVPVAILSSATFDATTVNPTTITLAGASVRLKGNGTPLASYQDVNNDGRLDLVVQVSIEALQLSDVDTQATLTGQTSDGKSVTGNDYVRIVP